MVIPKNIGSYPAVIKPSYVVLRIGDEEYPTIRDMIALAPNQGNVVMPVGHINENGINNIRQGRYRTNRMELEIIIESKSIDDKKFKYKSHFLYEINVSADIPQFKCIKQMIS